jgi:hypothetical protein
MFFIGSVLAFVARRELVARSPSPFGPSAWVAAGYACWFWVSVSWMMVEAPDWMLCYFVDSVTISLPLAHGLFLLSLVMAALSGHVLTAVQLQRGRTPMGILVAGAGLVLWLGLWVLTLDRYLAFGSTADWLAGDTEPIATSAVSLPMNIVGALTGLGLLLPVIFLVSRSRRLRSL